MPKVDVVDLNNQKVGEIELSDAVFGAEVKKHLIYESVRHYLAGQRSGSAKTKVRWEVAGSGKKLWRQKGTGRARVGSVRSPLWRHGGTIHGPVPRDYSYRLNKKMVLGALRSALTSKLQEGKLKVVSNLTPADHRTRTMAGALQKLEADRSVLLVAAAGPDRNLELSSRNLAGVKLVATKDVTTYDLLSHKHVVLSEAAARKLSEALQ
ncbi:MAG: 50S ribosomal protein L4 [Bryobacteraceae bacterium]|nr:50S ribosomal protein L4 [Bryobacteraceae bacterium]